MFLKPTASVPSTVQFDSVPLVGVPRTGVTKVGEVANTNEPEPVSSVTVEAKLAEDGVPNQVATPDPKEVIPVPPLATGKVPVTPVVKGNPVRLVAVPLVGVPRIGVTKVGDVANTKEPEPVSSVTAAAKFALDGVPSQVATPVPNDVIPVPPFATGRVPVTPVLKGNPVRLVAVPLEGVPKSPPLTTNAPAVPVLTPRAVTTPVPVVVVLGATPAPPPIIKAFDANNPEDAKVPVAV